MRLTRHRRRPPASSARGEAGGPASSSARPSWAALVLTGMCAGAVSELLGRAARARSGRPTLTEDPTPAGRPGDPAGDAERPSRPAADSPTRLMALRVVRSRVHRCQACGAPTATPTATPTAAPAALTAGSGAVVDRSSPSSGPRAGGRRWRSVAALVMAAVGLMLFSGGVTLVAFGPPAVGSAEPVAAQGVLPVGRGSPDQGPEGLVAPAMARGPATAAPLPAAPPTHVSIPAVGVNTDLIDLGTADDGTLQVPRDFAVAGWWDQGAAPGDPGPAVIVGHIDSYRGPAVFYRLRQLTPGAMVTVARSDGSSVVFVVDALREFSKGAFPTDLVYGDTDSPTLRLITCGGSFDYQQRSYLDNIVVFAHQLVVPAATSTAPSAPSAPSARPAAPSRTLLPASLPPSSRSVSSRRTAGSGVPRTTAAGSGPGVAP